MLCNDGTSVLRRPSAFTSEPEPAPAVVEPLASTSPAIPVVDELDDEPDEDELALLSDDELLGDGEL